MTSPPSSNQPSRAWKVIKGVGGVLAAFLFWLFYYSGSPDAPPVPKDGLKRELPSHTPSNDPKEIAKEFAEGMKIATVQANEATMVANLRIISTSVMTYQAEHENTVPDSLDALGREQLIDAYLAGGHKGGYAYIYEVGRTQGQIDRYAVWARPETYNRSSAESCVTNQSAEIHCTFENRYATFDDPAKE